MLGIADPLGYVTIAFLLVLTPGPATVYILSRGYQLGLPAGFTALAGCTAGDICLMLLAALGVAALLHNYPLAFDIVRWLGAGYLVWLGFKALWPWRPAASTGPATPARVTPVTRSLPRIFVGGMGVIFVNPKAILFFMAFFPQFVDPVQNRGAITFVALGVIFISMNICYLGSLMLIGGRLRRNALGNRGFTFWINKLTGLAFIGFGVKLATSTLR
ncbi:MAG TPA: LysE family transporter [Dongiaceae bacterium]|nr:LysE family transporter [Dongiaceae bacterium]